MLEPQYLEGVAGRLFTIFYPPAPDLAPRGSVLFVHPFAEEMNKARRMAALQARRLAAGGYAVMMPDLYGCGDSDGDFLESRWEIWLHDLHGCLDWLRARAPGPMFVWGLRVGGLLAAELVRENKAVALVLWQPVLKGEQVLNQFLRLRTAASMFAGQKETVKQLRASLNQGMVLEVAGYCLHPDLAAALAAAELPRPAANTRVAWFETTASTEKPLPLPTQRIVEDWRAGGVALEFYAVTGDPFWSMQEIALAPNLLDTTTAWFTRNSG